MQHPVWLTDTERLELIETQVEITAVFGPSDFGVGMAAGFPPLIEQRSIVCFVWGIAMADAFGIQLVFDNERCVCMSSGACESCVARVRRVVFALIAFRICSF